jgi:hypothetical protein
MTGFAGCDWQIGVGRWELGKNQNPVHPVNPVKECVAE